MRHEVGVATATFNTAHEPSAKQFEISTAL
jgi:hypothetical protein